MNIEQIKKLIDISVKAKQPELLKTILEHDFEFTNEDSQFVSITLTNLLTESPEMFAIFMNWFIDKQFDIDINIKVTSKNGKLTFSEDKKSSIEETIEKTPPKNKTTEESFVEILRELFMGFQMKGDKYCQAQNCVFKKDFAGYKKGETVDTVRYSLFWNGPPSLLFETGEKGKNNFKMTYHHLETTGFRLV